MGGCGRLVGQNDRLVRNASVGSYLTMFFLDVFCGIQREGFKVRWSNSTTVPFCRVEVF